MCARCCIARARHATHMCCCCCTTKLALSIGKFLEILLAHARSQCFLFKKHRRVPSSIYIGKCYGVCDATIWGANICDPESGWCGTSTYVHHTILPYMRARIKHNIKRIYSYIEKYLENENVNMSEIPFNSRAAHNTMTTIV